MVYRWVWLPLTHTYLSDCFLDEMAEKMTLVTADIATYIARWEVGTYWNRTNWLLMLESRLTG